MAKMTKHQLIDAIAEGKQVSEGNVKAVIEQMATVGYKELNESGEFVIPGFVKMSVVNKPDAPVRILSNSNRVGNHDGHTPRIRRACGTPLIIFWRFQIGKEFEG